MVEVKQWEDVCVIRFAGRVATGADLLYLENQLGELNARASGRVLADFRDVASLGSTGLTFLARAFVAVTGQPGGRFVVAGANPRVRQALDLTGLSAVIPLADDLDSGFAALSRRSAGAC